MSSAVSMDSVKLMPESEWPASSAPSAASVSVAYCSSSASAASRARSVSLISPISSQVSSMRGMSETVSGASASRSRASRSATDSDGAANASRSGSLNRSRTSCSAVISGQMPDNAACTVVSRARSATISFTSGATACGSSDATPARSATCSASPRSTTRRNTARAWLCGRREAQARSRARRSRSVPTVTVPWS